MNFLQSQCDILQCCQMWVEVKLLKNKTYLLTQVLQGPTFQSTDRLLINIDLAVGNGLQLIDQTDKGRFSGT